MADVNQVDAKYVFMDVVGFTRGRSVEAQTDIIGILNEIVRATLQEHDIEADERILLPTGDGICVAVLGGSLPYDIHIQIALGILEKLQQHNDGTEDKRRQFELRIGINANTDNLVIDINGQQNAAGAGINIAQRVMDMADGNQVLISQSVYDTLRQREMYMGAFREHEATLKHGERVHVYQLMMKDSPGLSIEEPQRFRKPKQKHRRLTKEVAYYIAHALAHRQALRDNKDRIYNDDIVIILFSFLAKDSVQESEATDIDMVIPVTYRADSFWERYEYYRSQDNEFIWHLGRKMTEPLWEFNDCFVQDSFGLADFRAISDQGQRRLREEWPSIWKEFNFDAPEEEAPSPQTT